MTVLRSVVGRAPASRDLWNDTSLPWSVIYTIPEARVPQGWLNGMEKCPHCGAPLTCTSILCQLCGQEHSLNTLGLDIPSDACYALPLRLRETPDRWQMPAVGCPLLYAVILDGACQERNYWQLISEQMTKLVTEAPDYIHMTLMVACTDEMLAVFHLASSVPMVRHYQDATAAMEALLNSTVPLLSHRPHVLAACRSLLDYAPPPPTAAAAAAAAADVQPPSRQRWRTAIEPLVEVLASDAHVVGNRENEDSPIIYAGGKVLCLAAQGLPGNHRNQEQEGGLCRHGMCRPDRKLPDDNSHNDSDNLLIDTTLQGIYQNLAEMCAQQALGVDWICLRMPHNRQQSFELETFAAAWASTGAAAAVIIPPRVLYDECMSRAPWKEGMVYGAEFRVRVSPGLNIEQLQGAAVPVGESLWRMGCADTYSSFLMDLQVEKLREYAYVGGVQEPLEPVIQACLAYTTIVWDEASQTYNACRQMRITNLQLPFARSVEKLYNHVDPEVLATVLFHRLVQSATEDGLAETVDVAEEWLKSLLICVYKSAEEQAEVEREKVERGLSPSKHFIAAERLLSKGGELSNEDVLLAQGHPRLSMVPLMVYLLLQSDALREAGFSSDQRTAARLQLLEMSPSSLTRYLAPRLQLWDVKEDEVVLDVIELRANAVQTAVMEYCTKMNGVLLVDTPHTVAVIDAGFIYEQRSRRLQIGNNLQDAIDSALESYRSPPPVRYMLQSDDIKAALSLLSSVLKEDCSVSIAHASNFGEWKTEIAEAVAGA